MKRYLFDVFFGEAHEVKKHAIVYTTDQSSAISLALTKRPLPDRQKNGDLVVNARFATGEPCLQLNYNGAFHRMPVGMWEDLLRFALDDDEAAVFRPVEGGKKLSVKVELPGPFA